MTESSYEWRRRILLNGFEDDLLLYDAEQSVCPPNSVFAFVNSPLRLGQAPQHGDRRHRGCRPLNGGMTRQRGDACKLHDGVGIEALTSVGHWNSLIQKRTVGCRSEQLGNTPGEPIAFGREGMSDPKGLS